MDEESVENGLDILLVNTCGSRSWEGSTNILEEPMSDISNDPSVHISILFGKAMDRFGVEKDKKFEYF